MNRIAKFFMLSCGVMTCMFLSGCFNAPTTLNYKHADRYTMGGATITDSVRNIDINWIGGNVDVLTHNENTVSFSETSDNALDENTTLYYYLEGDTLHIQFGKARKKLFNQNISKNLTVYVPEGAVFEDIDVDNVSSSFNIQGVSCDSFEADTVSGDVTAQLNAVREFKVDSVSADCRIESSVAPDELEADMVSGNIELTIPEGSGFKVSFDTVSGKLNSEFEVTKDDDEYICGDGKADYSVETVSGGITIKKLAANII